MWSKQSKENLQWNNTATAKQSSSLKYSFRYFLCSQEEKTDKVLRKLKLNKNVQSQDSFSLSTKETCKFKLQNFTIKKAFKLAQNKLEKMWSEKKSKDSSYFTMSLRKFLWSNTLNMMVQSQNILSMSHVGLKCLEILYIKDESSVQKASTAQRKWDFPTSLNTGF